VNAALCGSASPAFVLTVRDGTRIAWFRYPDGNLVLVVQNAGYEPLRLV
jgi:hypothetical protein